jgi:Domain of unknown function (DUF4129)
MRSRIFFLTTLLASWLPACAQSPIGIQSPAAASELDLQSYPRELARIEEASKNPEQIREIRKSLPETWKVKDGDRVYFVPTREISDALLQIERNPKNPVAGQLETRLQSMQRQAQALSRPMSSPSALDAETDLKKILNRAEFREATGPSPWDLARARMNRWILDHVIKLLNRLRISQKTGNAVAWVVLILAVWTLFYAIYRSLTNSAKPADSRAEAEPMPSDVRRWIQEALAAADRGDFREAVHCAYWASVAHLEDIRMLPRDRARTPRESLGLLELHPKEQGVLQTLTRNFELIWYGYRPVSAADWTGTKQQLEKMGCLEVSIAPTVPS